MDAGGRSGRSKPVKESLLIAARKTHACKMQTAVESESDYCLTHEVDSFQQVIKQAYESIGGDAGLQ